MFCEKCGEKMHDSATYCEKCGYSAAQPALPVEEPEKKENVLLGTVGAAIGALIGIGTIILFGMINMISALSGLALAFCTVKGYELLGKKLSKKGIAICILLILIAPYLGNRISYALVLVDELGYSFGRAFEYIERTMSRLDLGSYYLRDLVMIYVFCGLGAVGTLVNTFKRRR